MSEPPHGLHWRDVLHPKDIARLAQNLALVAKHTTLVSGLPTAEQLARDLDTIEANAPRDE